MDREEVFRDVFTDHYTRVVRTVFWIVQDWDRSEEIAQDAFVQLLRHWRAVSGHDQPDAWVRRVAIRLAVKAAAREQRLAVALRRSLVSSEAVTMPGPPVSAEVLDAVRQLPPKQRAAVALRYFEDRSFEQVADVLDCSPATARVHIHRARQRLAELLGEEVGSHDG